MPTGGRTRVYIDATADQLEREIKRAELALERLGREGMENGTQAAAGMERATLASRGYAKAAAGMAVVTSRVGSAARSAAPWVGAGLALGLAKSVAEYREAEKVGSQTNAVIKSTGGVANESAQDLSNYSEKLAEKIGMDDEAIQSGGNLLLTFTNIRNEVGKNNDIFNQTLPLLTDMSVALGTDLKSSALQLGKALNDPATGLTALRRSGVQFDEQQQEQIKTLFASGEQLKAQKMILAEVTKEFGGSAKAQADSFDKLMVSAENFAEQIGGEVTPVLADMADGLSEILSNDKLTSAERMDKLGAFFEEWAQKGIDTLTEAAPDIAKVGADIAGMAIEGFANAWWDSDALGKLFLGAGALRMLGGPGVFGKLGGMMAGRMAKGAIASSALAWGPYGLAVAAAVGTVYLAYKLKAADHLLDAAGITKDGVVLVEQWNDTFAETRSGLLRTSLAATQLGEGLHITKTDLRAATQGANVFADSFGDSADDMVKFERVVKRRMDDVGDAVKDAGKLMKGFAEDSDDALGDAGNSTDKFSSSARKDLVRLGTGFTRIGGQVEDFATDGSDDMGRFTDGSRRMAKGVGRNIIGVAGVITDGLRVIGHNTDEALSAYGVKKVSLALESVGGAATGHQAGGSVFQVPGHGNGDSFHTAVPNGSFILNRNAVNDFFGLQAGGMAPVVLEPGELVFDPLAASQFGGWLPWANDQSRRFAKGGIVGLGHQLQGQGYEVSENPAFGGVTPGSHVTGSYHDSGQAIDVNDDAAPFGYGSSEKASLDNLYSRLQGMAGVIELLWQVPGHYDHLHVAMAEGATGTLGGAAAAIEKIKRVMVEGTKGPMRGMSQGALDMTWKAAKGYVASKRPSQVGAGSAAVDANFSGPVGDQMGKYLLAHGANKIGAAGIMGNAWQESGWNPAAMEPGTDNGGLFGFTASPVSLADLRAYAAKQSKPWTDVETQVQFMLNNDSGGLAAANSAGSLEAATSAFMTIFERPNMAYANLPNRIAGAEKAWDMGYSRGGVVGRKGSSPAMRHAPGLQRGGFARGGKSHIGGIHVSPPHGSPPALTYQEQMTIISIALSNAEQTATTTDDQALLEQRGTLISDELASAQSALDNVHLTGKDKHQALAAARQDVAKLEKKLSKGGLTPAEARRLDKARREAYKQEQSDLLGEKRSDALDKVSELTDELNSNTDQLKALTEESNADLISAITSLQESVDNLAQLSSSESAVQNSELVRAIADLLSGEIGGRTSMLSLNAGNGSVAAL